VSFSPATKTPPAGDISTGARATDALPTKGSARGHHHAPAAGLLLSGTRGRDPGTACPVGRAEGLLGGRGRDHQEFPAYCRRPIAPAAAYRPAGAVPGREGRVVNVVTDAEWAALLAANEPKHVWYCPVCGRGSSVGPCGCGGAR